jgi:methyl-accepting chemotaxis protein
VLGESIPKSFFYQGYLLDVSKGGAVVGDTFHLSGDFKGAILNIKSTLRDVQQSVGEIPDAGPAQVEQLQGLIDDLTKALEQIPPEKEEQAQAVAETAKLLVDSAKAETPNKTMIRITGEGLKKAAENLAEAAPAVIGLATQIVVAVLKITGSTP